MSVAIVTDSTADLDQALLTQYQITTIPLSVAIGETYYLDRVELTPTQFMDRLTHTREPVRTAAPAPGAFATVYRELLAQEGVDSIVSIHLSGGLSFTVRAAQAGARLVNGDITVIDSQNASVGCGLLVWWAARRAQRGATQGQIVSEVQALVPKIQLLFAPVTLEYLARGGRIGQAARLIGTMLDMKPILEVDHGIIKAAKKVRGVRHIIPAMIQLFGERITEGSDCLLAIVSTTPVPELDQLSHMLSENYHIVAELRAEAGPVIGAHAGPGAFGAILCPLETAEVVQWNQTES
ncbi:MAG: DegV family protein [Firmicutes bacterium]|jgi:DegV family protein with EDD domain|nr:DegV family protein [Bacillota bacterium]